MTATQPDLLQQPVWIAALLASSSRVVADPLVRHRIRSMSGQVSLRFINNGSSPVLIPALGINLLGGSEIDVRWPAGATGYELRCVAHPAYRPSRLAIMPQPN